MICPKCQEGRINKITFKKDNRIAYVCDYCESLWLEGEKIGPSSSHTLTSFSERDLDFSYEEATKKDQDHQPLDRGRYE